MRPRDADIPKAVQGDIAFFLVADDSGRRGHHHPLATAGVNDPRLQAAQLRQRFQCISEATADRIADILDTFPNGVPFPSRAEVLQRLLPRHR